MMRSQPRTNFVIPHPQKLFALLEAGFNRPSHPRESNQRRKLSLYGSVGQISFQFTIFWISAENQPNTGTGQPFSGSNYTHNGKVCNNVSLTSMLDGLPQPFIGGQSIGDFTDGDSNRFTFDELLPRRFATPALEVGEITIPLTREPARAPRRKIREPMAARGG